MKPVFEDDYWDVAIQWTKPISYDKAKNEGSKHDEFAYLYMISVRYSTNKHKPVYIGKTFEQDVQTRLKQYDHVARYKKISNAHPKSRIFVRYGLVSMDTGKVTKKRIKDIENILIYCYDNDHCKNIKSIYTHGVSDSYSISNSGYRSELPKTLAFGFFER
jgi:hypothetical protein